jgi:3-phenylpropionate/trans-cinnamate dioxygenase ferredoxin component
MSGSEMAQPVATVSEFPASGLIAVDVNGEQVVICRAADGTIHAVQDRCSHAEVALSEGEIEGCEIECWLHGARFDLRTGAPSGLPATEPIPVYAVTVDGDDIYVDTTPVVLSNAAKEQSA